MTDIPKFVIRERYSTGRLESPTEDDDQFAGFMEAEIAATEASIDDAVWAVWENTTGELLAICYQQQCFRP